MSEQDSRLDAGRYDWPEACVDAADKPVPGPTEDEINRLEKAAWDAGVDRALVWYRDQIDHLRKRMREADRAAKLERQRAIRAESQPSLTPADLIALRGFVQHKPNCGVEWCWRCPNEPAWHLRNNHHTFEPKPCTCGLDTLITRLSCPTCGGPCVYQGHHPTNQEILDLARVHGRHCAACGVFERDGQLVTVEFCADSVVAFARAVGKLP